MNVSAVVALPKTQTRSGPHRINSPVKTVAAFAHLPLHRTSRATGKCDRTRAVVLRTAVGLRVWRSREIAADVAGIKFDRIQTRVHVEPSRARIESSRCPVDAAIVAGKQCSRRAGYERERVVIHMHSAVHGTIAARGADPCGARIHPQADLDGVEKAAGRNI